MESINYMISSLIEYIDIIISIAINKNLKEYIDELDNLKEQVSNIKTLEDINKYKIIIQEYDKKINEAKKVLFHNNTFLLTNKFIQNYMYILAFQDQT